MYCIQCGERVVESAQFCAACGEKIQRPQDEEQRSERPVLVPPISETSEASGDLIADAVPAGERQHSEPVVAEAPRVESVVTPAEEITADPDQTTLRTKPVKWGFLVLIGLSIFGVVLYLQLAGSEYRLSSPRETPESPQAGPASTGSVDDSFEAVQTRANTGDGQAQYNLGLMYANGEGVPQNDAESLRWFRLAADQGLAEAQAAIGVMYTNGRGVPQDDVEALRLYRLAAEGGDAFAQFNLGVAYRDGEGVSQNDTEELRWFRLAADQGLAEAQYSLGRMYHAGEGVQEDKVEAFGLFRLAAEAGLAEAQGAIGIMYANGEGFLRDLAPVEYRDAAAVRWFRLAVDQGAAEAQYFLGTMYSNGRGVPQDDVEALRLYRMAAEGGMAEAQYNLGLMYAEGRGVQQDDVTAYMWINLAASRMEPSVVRGWAVSLRDSVGGKLNASQLTEAERLADEWRPRARGINFGLTHLGSPASGLVLPQDRNLAGPVEAPSGER